MNNNENQIRPAPHGRANKRRHEATIDKGGPRLAAGATFTRGIIGAYLPALLARSPMVPAIYMGVPDDRG